MSSSATAPKYLRLPVSLFTSVEKFINSSEFFPTHDRRIGISIRAGYHPEYHQNMVEIDEERPSFISTNRGEYVTIDLAEEKVKERILELAEYCLKVSEELKEHSNRLIQILETCSGDNSTILDMEKIREMERNETRDKDSFSQLDYVDPIHSSSSPSRSHRSESRTHPHARASSTSKEKSQGAKSLPSLNLALLE